MAFDLENCINLRDLLKDNEIQWLINKEPITEEMINTLLKYSLGIDINYKQLTKENIDLLHSNNIKINCWTCDDKFLAERLMAFGVDFITTNILEQKA